MSDNRSDPVNHAHTVVARKETLADRLLTKLRQQILTGYLAPGQLIPPEEELSEAFGVGRTTVREALRGLVEAGFAERRQRRLVVIDRTALGGEQVAFASLDARAAVRDVYEVRKILETNAAARAAEHWAGSELERLRSPLEAMNVVDTDDFHRADTEFHIEIVRLAKNPILMEVFERSHELFFRLPAYWRVFGLPRAGHAPAAHRVKRVHYRRIFDAIKRRDATDARNAMFTLLDLLEWDVIERMGDAGASGASAPPFDDQKAPIRSAKKSSAKGG